MAGRYIEESEVSDGVRAALQHIAARVYGGWIYDTPRGLFGVYYLVDHEGVEDTYFWGQRHTDARHKRFPSREIAMGYVEDDGEVPY